MPRQAGVVVDNDLTKGLITEATGLNFPENACTDTINCVFDEISRVTRRKGFDYEVGFVNKTIDRDDSAVVQYLWKNVGGNGSISFVVIQVGLTLYFYEITGAGALSTGALVSTVNLASFAVSGAPSAIGTECAFTNGLGYLFVTNQYLDPFFVSYNSVTQTFTATRISLEIRDFEGVDDGLDVENRPSTLSNAHKYNLYNQGWYITALYGASSGSSSGTANVLTAWDSLVTAFPANSDVWWLFKGPENDGTNPEVFRPGKYLNVFAIGNSPAPKGHYVLNLHRQDRSSDSGVSGIPVVSSGTDRVSTNAFFAGRVFYSGLSQDKFVGKVYFSQIIERNTQFGQCYQVNDPTSEQNSDLLPSDGGVIAIAEAGRVLKMVAIGNSLLVWATNGVWAIMGSEGLGFTASDYSVRKIASTATLSASSFVDVQGIPMWWNSDGIYTVAAQDGVGGFQLQNISDPKIKTFLDDIPLESKSSAKGAYNAYDKTVQWVYRSVASTTTTNKYEFDRALILNVVSGAFFPWTISASNIKVSGISVVEGYGSTYSNETVVDNNGVTVTTGAGAVEVQVLDASVFAPIFKYIVSSPSGATYLFTFAEANNDSLFDWVTSGDIVDYDSNFTLGFKIHGEGIRKWQPTYLKVYVNNEQLTTFDVQGLWDYATSGNTGRWSSVQRKSFSDTRYSTVSNRIKVRGHGKALQIKIMSVSGEPFDIIGFSTFETGNATP